MKFLFVRASPEALIRRPAALLAALVYALALALTQAHGHDGALRARSDACAACKVVTADGSPAVAPALHASASAIATAPAFLEGRVSCGAPLGAIPGQSPPARG